MLVKKTNLETANIYEGNCILQVAISININVTKADRGCQTVFLKKYLVEVANKLLNDGSYVTKSLLIRVKEK